MKSSAMKTSPMKERKKRNKYFSYLGALTDSMVKVTSGALPLGVVAFPNKTTVSPLRTFLTRATPLEGRIVGRGAGATAAGAAARLE